jgi:outer membrane protein assembly factor BamB
MPLDGPPDSAPAVPEGHPDVAFVHADSGTLTAFEIATGAVRWTAACGAGFDAAPVVRDAKVFSATTAGEVLCHEADAGDEVWRVGVSRSPCGGTPAHDGTLLYVPADDGLHLVSSGAGRAVRRYGLPRPVRAAPIVSARGVFFGTTEGSVYGLDTGSGGPRALHLLYETGTAAGAQIVAAPALADGALFVASTNGVLYALSVG